MTRSYRNTSGPTAHGYNNGVYAGFTLLPGTSEWKDSVGHSLNRLGISDCGGPFLLSRNNYYYSLAKSGPGKWKGSDLVVSGGPGASAFSGERDSSDMFTDGATAIARSLPTRPSFEALTSMSEVLRDGIPSMLGVSTWKNRTKVANSAGDEYLNVQFGWLPLVNDIRKFAKMVKNHSEIMRDYKAGSSKVTRFGYGFPASTNSSSWSGNCFLYRGGNTGINSSCPATYVSISKTVTWFKGAMKYHVPASGGQLGGAAHYLSLANKLLGLKPTPSNLWNASPWTWALDWFGNAGDVMTNMSQLNESGSVLLYGYVMSSSKTEETIIAAANGFNVGSTAGTRTRVREFLKRLPSHPFGFGVTDGDLDAVQKATLIALGLSSGGRG